MTRNVTAVPSSTRKLHPVPELLAGVASWGRGTINGQDTDRWLGDFIEGHKAEPSITVFASRLASELNQAFGTRLTGAPSMGIHVAGYERTAEGLQPTFFHVHDGPSEMCKTAIDPKKINANHDCPPTYLRDLYQAGAMQIMRNGDFRHYAVISGALGSALRVLDQGGITIPASTDVASVTAFNVFEIRLMSDLYRMSGVVPGIGGRIDFLSIDSSGQMTRGSRD